MKNQKELATKIKNYSFEQAITRLEEISNLLSAQKIELESMVEIYEEAKILKQHCQKKLEDAKMKIEIINNDNPSQD
jgi:exodeoxyribonuclease VII small subunit